MTISISTGENVKRNDSPLEVLEFTNISELYDHFGSVRKIEGLTKAEYLEKPKEEKAKIKAAQPYWVGGKVKGVRKSDNLEHRSLFSGDIDNAPENWREAFDFFLKGIPYIAYTTLSHNPANGQHKVRLLIPFSSPVYGLQAYEQVAREIMGKFPADFFDSCSSVPVQAMFNPHELEDDEDFALILANENCPPYMVKKTDEAPKVQKVYRSPKSLPGVEGNFCSVYGVSEVLEAFGDGAYQKCQENRYLYTKGSGGAPGVVIYDDDEKLMSSHDTDPLNLGVDNQLNAFQVYAILVAGGVKQKAESMAIKEVKYTEFMDSMFIGMESEADALAELAVGILEPLCWQTFDHLAKSKSANVAYNYINQRLGKVMGDQSTKVVYRDADTNKYEFSTITALTTFCEDLPHISPPGADEQVNLVKYWRFNTPSGFKYNKIVYDPGAFNDKFIHKKDITGKLHGSLNMFLGYNAHPRFDDAYEEPVDFINYVREVLCSNNEEYYVWVMDWLANIFQDPKHKPGTALVLYSPEKGVGKSFLSEVLLKCLLGSSCIVLDDGALFSNFNSEIEGKLVVAGDEVGYTTMADANKLKSIVTKKNLIVEKKGIDRYEIADFSRIILTSNNDKSVHIDPDFGERRYTVLRVPTTRQGDVEYWDKMFSLTRDKKWQEDVLQYLFSRDITSNLHTALVTDSYKEFSQGRETPLSESLQTIIYDLSGEMESSDKELMFELKASIRADGLFISRTALRKYINDRYKRKFPLSARDLTKELDQSKFVADSGIIKWKKVDNQNCIGIPLTLLTQEEN